MKSLVRKGTVAGVSAALVMGGSVGAMAQGVDNTGGKGLDFTARVQGADRYETAVGIAKQAFPRGAEVVYVARGDVFADALAAGVLRDGPVVLSPSQSVNEAVKGYIKSSGAKKVVALGGVNAIGEGVLRGYGEAAGASVERISGKDRSETSVKIGERVFPERTQRNVYFADGFGGDGKGSPDAVVAGALTDGMIVLMGKAGDFHGEVWGREMFCLGAACGFPGMGDTKALRGKDRYETAAMIAKRAFPQGSQKVYVANGLTYVDAVAGGSLTDGPVLLVGPNGQGREVVEQTVRDLGAKQVVAIGGEKAVPAGVLKPQTVTKPTSAPAPGGVYNAGETLDLDKYPMQSVPRGMEKTPVNGKYRLGVWYKLKSKNDFSKVTAEYKGRYDDFGSVEVFLTGWDVATGGGATGGDTPETKEDVLSKFGVTQEQFELMLSRKLVEKVNEIIRIPAGLTAYDIHPRQDEFERVMHDNAFKKRGHEGDYKVYLQLRQLLGLGEDDMFNSVLSGFEFDHNGSSLEAYLNEVATDVVLGWKGSKHHYDSLTGDGSASFLTCGVTMDYNLPMKHSVTFEERVHPMAAKCFDSNFN